MRGRQRTAGSDERRTLGRSLLAGKDNTAVSNKVKFLIPNGKTAPSLLRDSETSYLLLFVQTPISTMESSCWWLTVRESQTGQASGTKTAEAATLEANPQPGGTEVAELEALGSEGRKLLSHVLRRSLSSGRLSSRQPSGDAASPCSYGGG